MRGCYLGHPKVAIEELRFRTSVVDARMYRLRTGCTIATFRMLDCHCNGMRVGESNVNTAVRTWQSE